MALNRAKTARLAQNARATVGSAAEFAHNLRMLAHVYKSARRPDTFVYLAARDDFARLPESLRAGLAPFTFVLALELAPERKLARASAVEVMENLSARGFHLQMPPSVAADPMLDDWGTDA